LFNSYFIDLVNGKKPQREPQSHNGLIKDADNIIFQSSIIIKNYIAEIGVLDSKKLMGGVNKMGEKF